MGNEYYVDLSIGDTGFPRYFFNKRLKFFIDEALPRRVLAV